VQRLPRILLEVDSRNPDARRPCGTVEDQVSIACERPLVLGDLVALREIGIEIVLAREDRRLVDSTGKRERGTDGEVDRRAIQHRQCARKPKADGTHVRIGRSAERGAAAAEDL
jgi:hypothetical protein